MLIVGIGLQNLNVTLIYGVRERGKKGILWGAARKNGAIRPKSHRALHTSLKKRLRKLIMNSNKMTKPGDMATKQNFNSSATMLFRVLIRKFISRRLLCKLIYNISDKKKYFYFVFPLCKGVRRCSRFSTIQSLTFAARLQ